MAKATMGRSRFKIQRRLGVELPGLGKAGALERRPYGPGQHGMKRKKLSDLTIRLVEKQKVVFHYGLRERQLVRLVKKAKKNMSRAWVDTLVIGLEKRLDNIIFRLNWAPSILAARQMVGHKHVLVNGKKVNMPNFELKIGDEVTLTEKGFKSGAYLQAKAKPRLSTVPACLAKQQIGEVEKAKLIADPISDDIPFAFEKRFVTEFYWKIK